MTGLVLLLAAAPTPGHAVPPSCPELQFYQWNLDNPPSVPLHVAAWDTTLELRSPEAPEFVYGWGEVSFDLRSGVIHAHTAAYDACSVLLRLADEFVISGLPTGTPVEAVAELHVAGVLEHWDVTHSSTIFECSLRSGSAHDTLSAYSGPGAHVPRPFDGTLRITIHAQAGVPFEVRAYLDVGLRIRGYGEGLVDAEWSVRADTPGAIVTSCYGYGNSTTPSLPASWGELKARYR